MNIRTTGMFAAATLIAMAGLALAQVSNVKRIDWQCGRGAELATYVVEKGKPLITPAR